MLERTHGSKMERMPLCRLLLSVVFMTDGSKAGAVLPGVNACRFQERSSVHNKISLMEDLQWKVPFRFLLS
jgi:hypothetical protein